MTPLITSLLLSIPGLIFLWALVAYFASKKDYKEYKRKFNTKPKVYNREVNRLLDLDESEKFYHK